MRSCSNPSKLSFNNTLSVYVLQHEEFFNFLRIMKENLACCDIFNALCGRGKIIYYFETSSFLKIVFLWILLAGNICICNILVFAGFFVIKIIAEDICVKQVTRMWSLIFAVSKRLKNFNLMSLFLLFSCQRNNILYRVSRGVNSISTSRRYK